MLVVSCSAHDPNPVHVRLGIELGDQGNLEVTYRPCPGETVERLVLWEIDDGEPGLSAGYAE